MMNMYEGTVWHNESCLKHQDFGNQDSPDLDHAHSKPTFSIIIPLHSLLVVYTHTGLSAQLVVGVIKSVAYASNICFKDALPRNDCVTYSQGNYLD